MTPMQIRKMRLNSAQNPEMPDGWERRSLERAWTTDHGSSRPETELLLRWD